MSGGIVEYFREKAKVGRRLIAEDPSKAEGYKTIIKESEQVVIYVEQTTAMQKVLYAAMSYYAEGKADDGKLARVALAEWHRLKDFDNGPG